MIKFFPAEERYALADQVRRSVVSIPSNIAEGCGRTSDKDYAHFIAIARGSLYEVMTQLEAAKRLGYLSEDQLQVLNPSATEISKMLTSLLKKYGSLHPPTPSPTPTTLSN